MPFQKMEAPSWLVEYAIPVLPKPPVLKIAPSVEIALTRYEVEMGGITMPIFAVAVALSCVALNGVPYVMGAGVAQDITVVAGLTTSGTVAVAVV